MDLRTHFRHMDTSMPLYLFAEKKIADRLQKYEFLVVDAQVTFAVEHGEHSATCHLHLGDGAEIHAAGRNEQSMYAAVDQLTDRLDGCLRRHKEKLHSHRAPSPTLAMVAPTEAGDDLAAADAVDAAEVLSYEAARRRQRERRYS